MKEKKAVITQADWYKAMSGDRKCALCHKVVDTQHTPNLDGKKRLVHDYCLRIG
jgi:hypothetical protein